jgi:predicted transcriptional regulator
MRRSQSRRPTNAELNILRVLWRRGPSTVREVHAGLDRGPAVGYTTVLKLLQIMAEKGLVTRDASVRSHVYRARASEVVTQRRLVSDLLERAFGGSALGLVMQALSAKRPSSQELRQIRELLEELNGGKR